MSYLWTRGCCCVSSSIVGEVNWSLPSSKQVEIDKTLVRRDRVKLLRAIHASGSKVEGVKHNCGSGRLLVERMSSCLQVILERGSSTLGDFSVHRPIGLPVRLILL